MPLRIALIAALGEPLSAVSRTEPAVFAYELASALFTLAEATGDIAVDLFARRGSRTQLPLVRLDPLQVLTDYDDAPDADRNAADDALLFHVAKSGLLDGYDVVHALSPVLTPLQIAAASGAAIVQTVDPASPHPASRILPNICNAKRLQQVVVGRTASNGCRAVPAGVDLTRFVPAEKPSDDFFFSVERSAAAEEMSSTFGLPLRTLDDGNAADLLPHARAFVKLGSGSMWPMRALACGTAVIGQDVTAIDRDPARRQERRSEALALHGSRAMASHYCQLYRNVVETS